MDTAALWSSKRVLAVAVGSASVWVVVYWAVISAGGDVRRRGRETGRRFGLWGFGGWKVRAPASCCYCNRHRLSCCPDLPKVIAFAPRARA